MNIGIIRISTKADRYRLKQTIESTGVQVVQTIDSASMPPTIVFVGTEDQMLMAFKQAESLGAEYAKVLTHIREVSPKLIKALKEGPKFKPGNHSESLKLPVQKQFWPVQISRQCLMVSNWQKSSWQACQTRSHSWS